MLNKLHYSLQVKQVVLRVYYGVNKVTHIKSALSRWVSLLSAIWGVFCVRRLEVIPHSPILSRCVLNSKSKWQLDYILKVIRVWLKVTVGNWVGSSLLTVYYVRHADWKLDSSFCLLHYIVLFPSSIPFSPSDNAVIANHYTR